MAMRNEYMSVLSLFEENWVFHQTKKIPGNVGFEKLRGLRNQSFDNGDSTVHCIILKYIFTLSIKMQSCIHKRNL